VEKYKEKTMNKLYDYKLCLYIGKPFKGKMLFLSGPRK
jgi:hypothetical protein